MNLAAIYNTFDGEELLEGSIKQFYEAVDVVIIVYQTTSNYGEYYPDVELLVQRLQKQYTKVHLLKYEPQHGQGQYNERRKRQLGYEEAEALGCSHFLFVDNDEYYDTQQFQAAKQQISQHAYDTTACQLYTYYKKPIYRLKPIESYWVPFICTIKPGARIGRGFPVRVDPTRGILPAQNFYSFTRQQLMMHHYSYLRHNMARKLRNSSARHHFGNIDHCLQQINNWQPGQPIWPYDGYEVEVVEDVFGVEGQPEIHLL